MTAARTSSRLCTGLLILILIPAAALTCTDIDPVDLVPGDGVCTGIVRDGSPQTAYTEQELMDVVNGGAFLYLGHGFVSGAFQNYTVDVGGTPVMGTVHLFNQGTQANAQALYQDAASGSGDPIADWGGTGAARMLVGLFYVTVQFYEECFYGSIYVESNEEAGLVGARCLADAAAAAVRGAVPADHDSWGTLKIQYR